MKTDLHNHTEHSYDAEFPLDQMCRAAEAAGIGVFAITDHFEADAWEKHSFAQELPASFDEVAAKKGSVPFKLLAGVELGEQLQGREHARWLLGVRPWDFVIGSLHNTSGDPDPYYVDFAQVEDDAIFLQLKKYYRELLELAGEGDFDTLAHITYPYRYINAAKKSRELTVCPEQFDLDADRVFEALIRRGKALELNTSSTTRTEEDKALNIRYLHRYRELGGELITVGSDAHAPGRVGAGIAEAYEILKNVGFRSVCYFEQRKAIQVPLD